MHVIEDTRQKDKKHKLKHSCFYEMGVKVLRCALPFGDYSFAPAISVDTKETMGEIASNLTADHERFRHECEKAKEYGCHLYILVETEWEIRDVSDVHLWKNPRYNESTKCINGDRLEKIMQTMQRKYGVTFMFCHPLNSAEMILRILNGEFENGK